MFALGQGSTIGGIEALLSAGRSTKTPVGIVCDDQKTLRHAVVRYHDGMTIDDVVAQIPQYRLASKEGVIVVAPKTIPEQTASWLDAVIPQFSTGPATFAQIGTTLWMSVVVATAKNKPDTFFGVVGGRDPTVISKGFSLRDASVETILNAIVRSSAGAAWIVLPPSKRPEDAQPEELWGFVRYASGDPDAPIRSLCCVEWSRLGQ